MQRSIYARFIRVLSAGLLYCGLTDPAAAATFVIDSSQSFLNATGDLGVPGVGSVPVTAQAPGSLSSPFRGTIDASVTPGGVQFNGGTFTLDSQPGVFEPFGAPAQFGLLILNVLPGLNAIGAFRDFEWTPTSALLPVIGGDFDASAIQLAALQGTFDYALPPVIPPASTVPTQPAQNAGLTGSLSMVGGHQQLSFPISVDLIGVTNGLTLTMHFDGRIVANTPEPSTIGLGTVGIASLLAFGVRRCWRRT